jgi:hypothetical protein
MKLNYPGKGVLISALLLIASCSRGGVATDAPPIPPTPPTEPAGVVRIVGLCLADKAPNNDGLPPEQHTLGDCAISADRSAVVDLGSVRNQPIKPPIVVYVGNGTTQQFVGYLTFVPEWGCTRHTDPGTVDPGRFDKLGQYTLSCALTVREYAVHVSLIEAGTLHVIDHVTAVLTVTP